MIVSTPIVMRLGFLLIVVTLVAAIWMPAMIGLIVAGLVIAIAALLLASLLFGLMLDW